MSYDVNTSLNEIGSHLQETFQFMARVVWKCKAGHSVNLSITSSPSGVGRNLSVMHRHKGSKPSGLFVSENFMA